MGINKFTGIIYLLLGGCLLFGGILSAGIETYALPVQRQNSSPSHSETQIGKTPLQFQHNPQCPFFPKEQSNTKDLPLPGLSYSHQTQSLPDPDSETSQCQSFSSYDGWNISGGNQNHSSLWKYLAWILCLTFLALIRLLFLSSRYTFLKLRRWPVLLLLLFFAINTNGQCPATVTANYCILGNGQVQLTATSEGATGYLWNTGATGPITTVPGAGIYTVTVTGNGCNLTATINVGGDRVVNGNFSAGNTGFATAYDFVPDGTPGGLYPEGPYSISPNPNPVLHANFWGYDHTHFGATASQPYMVVNGNPAANKIVWMENVNIEAGVTYYFSIYTMSLNASGNWAILQLNINNNAVVTSYTLPPGVASNNNPFYHYYTSWNSGGLSGSVPISITDLNVIRSGNDFGLDDISFSRLNPVPLTTPTVGSNSPVCPGNTINLTSSVPGGGGSAPLTYSWTGPNGFTSTAQNPSIANSTTAMGGTYTVTVTDYFGCQVSGTVNVSVTSGITLTAFASSTPVCAGTPINLFSSSSSAFPTILLSENFNSPTNTWTKIDNSTPGTPPTAAAWTLRPDGYNNGSVTFHSNDNSQFYLSDSYSQNGTTTATILQSQVMSTVGFTTLSLNFWHYYQYVSSGESANVEVSTNGTTWTAVASYNTTQGTSTGFANPTINLNAYINNPIFYVRFNYSSTNHRARYWAIDNISLSGTSNNYQISWVSNPAGFTSTIANPVNVTPLVNTTYTVTYSIPGGCSQIATVPVTINTAPTITTQPQNVSVCGVAATFSVTATGATTYQWYESNVSPTGPWTILTNSPPYSGVTTNSLTINPPDLKDGYYYHCVVGNGTCTTTSSPALLTITGTGPAITQQPATLSKCVGESASFTVVSNGQIFQWQENRGSGFVNINNGGVYSGTTTASLNISNVTGLNSYQYLCVVTIPGCGSPLNSTAATLNVYPYPVINPNGNPASVTICPRINTSFSVSATGAITYQWQENGGAGWVNIVNGGIYSNALTSSLTLTSVPVNYNGYQYRCIIGSSGNCSIQSNPATLSITIEPAISVQPTDKSVCEGAGESATFSLTAIGSGTLNYQWQTSNDGTIWSPIGTNSPTLVLNNTNGLGNTQYRCVVTDVSCPLNPPLTSASATLKYKDKPPVTHPAPAHACADFGVFATFIVDGFEGVAYQWQVSTNGGASWNNLLNDVWGQELGVRSSELMVWTPDLNKNGYQYRCILTLSATSCSQPSDPALLTVTSTPFFNYLPNVFSISYCAGLSITLTANISGSYNYQWYKDGILLPGRTNDTIVVRHPGDYSARVTNQSTGCYFTKVPITVTETPASPPVSVSIAANANPVCSGTNVTFTATPTNGGTSPTYQWKKNGISVGANLPTYSNNTLVNGDVITCVLTANVECAENNSNPAISNAITMTVSTTPTVSVSITSSLGSGPIISLCYGTPITFTATPVNGGTIPSYQWKKTVGANTTNVGTNSATYTDATLNIGNNQIFCVLTSNLDCANPKTANSSIITISVVPSPTAYNVTGGGPYCFGGPPVTIGLDNSNSTTAYHLLRDGVDTGISHTETTGAFNFTPNQTAAGVYTVMAVLNSDGCNSPMSGSVIIGTAPVISVQPLSQAICAGSSVTFSVTATGLPDPVYQWQVNTGSGFTNVNNTGVYSGATTATLNITAAPAGMNGYIYQCLVTSGTCPAVPSNQAILTVNSLPLITAQPSTPAAVCSGSGIRTISVTATGTGLTYSWRKDGTPVSGGIYSGWTTNQLTLTNPTGPDAGNYDVVVSGTCAPPVNSIPVPLTVNALPNANIVYNFSPYCATGTATVTRTGQAGGTYSSTAGLAINSGTGAIDLAASTSGTYIVTYSFINGCSNSTTTIVTINALPVPTASSNSPVSSPICVGTSLNLFGSPAGMTTYAWTGPNGFTSGSQNPTIGSVTATSAGTYTLTVTNGNGCFQSTTTTVVINTLPVPTASGNSPVCEGASLNLLGGPAGMTTYAWTGPNGFISSSQNPSIPAVTVAAAGIYTLTVTNSNGCSAPTTTNVTISTHPVITVQPTPPPAVCSGNGIVTLSVTATGTGLTFTWLKNGLSFFYNGIYSESHTSTTSTLTLTNPTTADVLGNLYRVTVRSGACSVPSSSVTVTVNPLPTITLGTNPSICRGTTTANLTYSATTGSPDQYSIVYNTAAHSAGFEDVTNAALTASPIVLTVPAGAASGTYTGTLTVRNSATGCVSTVYSISVTLNDLSATPTITAGGPLTFCVGGSVTLTSSEGTSYLWSTGATTPSINVTTSGSYTVQVNIATSCQSAVSAPTVVTVTAANTADTPSSTPTLCINTALTNITIATTGATGIGAATGLPTGVTAVWAANVITISGTPTAGGTFNYSIPLTGGCGSVNATGTITVTPANTAGLPSSTPTLCINTALTNITIATTGATGIGAPTGLPAGVTAVWAANVITISGTPTASGTFNYSIPLTGGCGAVDATGTITVNPVNTAGLPSSTPTLCINTALTNITIATTGATGIGAPTGLPTGVTAVWAANVITISGTPTASGTFNYSIPLTGGCGAVNATGIITVNLVNTAGAPSSNPTLCINTALTNITIATTGATGTGAPTGLPAGVTAVWAANVITISGTPTAGGTFNYSIPLTGGCGAVDATGTIIVNPINTAGVPSSNPALCINTALTNITIATTGATGIGAATGLPAGVTSVWAANVITISGTPTASGTFNYSIPLTGGCGSVNATGTITVNAPPQITSQPTAPPAVCSGNGILILSITATGTNLNFTWLRNGLVFPINPPYSVNTTSTTSTLTLTNPTSADVSGNSYRVRVNGTCSPLVNSNSVTITLNIAPVISVQPASQPACLGSSATFSVTVNPSVTPLPTYQWRKNGTPINGATALTYTINPVGAGDQADYDVILTNTCGSVTSNFATLTVTAANTAGLPSSTPTLCINTALTNITIATTGATGIGAPTGLPAGVTAVWAANVITISGTPTASGTFNYSIPLTGGCGSVNATGTITVTPANTAGLPSSTPTLCINTALTNITIATTGATGIGAPTGLPTGVTAVWAANVITISGTPTAGGTFNYSIPLTGGCGTVNATGTITVTPANTAGLPSSTPTLCINTALTNITIATTGATGIGAATGLPAGVTAVWAANVITISGTPTAGGTFNYSIPLTGGCGAVNATGSITVNPTPTIDGSSTVCPGKTTQWTGSGTKALVNPWISGNTNVATVDDNGLITGVAAGTTQITYTDNNGCSKSMTIGVGALVTITQPLANKSGCSGGVVTFSASYSYSGQVIFNWYRLGTTDPILSGSATSSPIQLTLNNIGSNENVNGIQYRVEIGPSVIGCMVSSGSATLTVNTPPACSITGGLDAVCAGSTTTWSATAGMTSYSWSGPGGFTATTRDITISTAGTYNVTITDANGCQSNCSRTLMVNPLPSTSLIYHQ